MAAKSLTNAAARAAADAVVDRVDLGTTNPAGRLKVYGGAVPADADAALGGATLLSQHDMSNPAYGAAVDDTPGALATANAIADDVSADADGTASFFRQVDRDENAVWQGDVTVTSGGGDLELNTVNIVENGKVVITGFTYKQPES